MQRLLRRPALITGLLLVLAGLAAACASEKPAGRVHVLTWKDNVNPVMERYIDRGIDTAEKSDAVAVVIRLDTPGGLDSAMRDIVQRIEAASVPVIVYVSPSGGRAASAGTFITMAGHIAAMAPNTSIGAATPINADGGDIEGALGRKVINDAVSYIRGIAELRGRNADWAESAVRDAASINQTQAVELNVVDYVATGLTDLLSKANGRVVQVQDAAGGLRPVTINTAQARIYENDPNIFETVLNIIATPDIAFLLLSLGGAFLLFEVFNPNILGGVVGVICLMLGFFALGALPTNWAGVALILFGFILIGSELFVSGFGILGIGGVVSLIFGGLILTGSSETGFQVSRWLVISMGVVIGGTLVLFLGAIVRARKMPTLSGNERLIGARGRVHSRLNPLGYVYVEGERWEAIAEDPPLGEDTPVIVTGKEGLRLKVKRDPASIPLLPPAGGSQPPTGARV
ncbi:MAG TPA: nodulation protein NfeD [Dehalococcoidia bacterium]|nr:nodulation protein NfeD [Dehalococcoidia bacterium]